MAVSPKVSGATVGAAFTTLIIGIVGPHAFPHGMPADVQGLIGAGVTAAVTFAAGWFSRDEAKLVAKVAPEVKAVEQVYTKVQQSAGPVLKAVEQDAAPVVAEVAPVADVPISAAAHPLIPRA
jgi:hypothetical protein